MPRNMMISMPRALQRSASQPAGIAPAPNRKTDGVMKAISSPNGRPNSASSAITVVG